MLRCGLEVVPFLSERGPFGECVGVMNGVNAATSCPNFFSSRLAFLLADNRFYSSYLFSKVQVKLLLALALIVEVADVLTLVSDRTTGRSKSCICMSLAEASRGILSHNFARCLRRQLPLGSHGDVGLV